MLTQNQIDLLEHPVVVDTFINDYIKLKEQLQPVIWHELDLHNGLWRVFGLIAPYNKRIYPNCDIAHKTLDLIHQIATPVTLGFSILEPGAIIYPHQGYSGEVFRVHVGLQIPTNNAIDCGIQIENTYYGWEVGKVLQFDDTKVHSAWNHTSKNRIVLLMDFEK